MTVSTITPYLFFSGRCEEALEFYRTALGAELLFKMYHRESPHAPPPGMLQPGFEDKVMHASVRIGSVQLMVSDGCDDKTKFSGFAISLTMANEHEVRAAFDALAVGGQIGLPVTQTFWSPCFGMVTDRFGVQWMLTVPEPPKV